jgi:hypothetical protein
MTITEMSANVAVEDPEELAGSGFQWLVAALTESRELAMEPDPILRLGDHDETAADLELRLSCF